ncbi:hypothetical protein PS1_038339 [Malus domestica]
MLRRLDTAYNLPETVDNLLESADSLPGSREPHVYTGMVLPDSELRRPGSGRLHRGLTADGYQVLEATVRELPVVEQADSSDSEDNYKPYALFVCK